MKLYKYLSIPAQLSSYAKQYRSIKKIENALEPLKLSHLGMDEFSRFWLPIKKLNDLMSENIYFSCVSEFNDITEGMFLVDEKTFMDEGTKHHPKYQLEQDFNKFNINGYVPLNILVNHSDFPHGIYSLCQNNDSIFMWNEYTERHSGICVEFELNVTDDQLRVIDDDHSQGLLVINEEDQFSIFISKVKYGNRVKLIHGDNEIKSHYISDSREYKSFSKADLKIIDSFFTKMSNYKNELEYRICYIKKNKGLVSISDLRQHSSMDSLLKLKAIIFGTNTSEEIKELIAREREDLKYYETKIDFTNDKVVIANEYKLLPKLVSN